MAREKDCHMKIIFTHNEKTIEIEYLGTGNGEAKLYGVPTDYSEDGYYVSSWQKTEIEPVPACAVSDAHLLCHVNIEKDRESFVLKTVKTTEGADCHA